MEQSKRRNNVVGDGFHPNDKVRESEGFHPPTACYAEGWVTEGLLKASQGREGGDSGDAEREKGARLTRPRGSLSPAAGQFNAGTRISMWCSRVIICTARCRHRPVLSHHMCGGARPTRFYLDSQR